MRKLQIIGLAFAAVLALGAVTASSAFALEWLANGAAITSPLAVDSTGTLELEDMGAGVKLLCEGTDEGTVGPGSADSVTKIEATKCTTEAGSCGTPNAKAVHLPWTTTLGATRDTISSSGAGAPGWDVICFGFIEDTCEGTTTTGIVNNENGTVTANFDESSEAATCKIGGAGSGLVHGPDINLATGGASLSTS